MNKKRILHHQKTIEERGYAKFSISIVLLTSLTSFTILMNAAEPDSNSQVPIVTPAVGGPATNAEVTFETSEDVEILAFAEPVLPPQQNKPVTHIYKIQPGDTLSHILERYNVFHAMKELVKDKKNISMFDNLRASDTIKLTKHHGSLLGIVYQPSPLRILKLTQQDDGSYLRSEEILEIEKLETHATVEIADSLYLSAKRMGLSDKLIISMAGVLEWDIDFAYDIRKGDRFTVIYEENYIKGKKVKDGDILAIDFINNGKRYRIFRYENVTEVNDYYFEDGRKVRKAFLRNPLEYAYISSHFNPRRRHPILHKITAHRGVDYAARTGTPVRASGDGKIIRRSSYKGYGNTVVLQHGGRYSTLYAHLSKFARNQRVGSYIKQGQVIGYVGSTGLSTGPHLHYEFRVNGVHKNPITVELPSATPLAKSEMHRFKRQIQPLMTKLNTIDKVYTANAFPIQP